MPRKEIRLPQGQGGAIYRNLYQWGTDPLKYRAKINGEWCEVEPIPPFPARPQFWRLARDERSGMPDGIL